MPELESKNTWGRTVLGLAGLVFGACYLIAGFSGLLQVSSLQQLIERREAPQLLTAFSEAFAYLDASVNVVLAALLIAAGIGLLMQRQWGAAIGTKWAITRIIWSVVAAAMALLGPFAARPDPETLPHGYQQYMEHYFSGTALTGIFVGLVLSSILAVIFLCLLSRPTYKDHLS